MDVRMESREQMAARNRKQKNKKRKRQRPAGKAAPSPKETAGQARRELVRRESEWRERLEADPAAFAEIELEVHAQHRRHADLFVAGLLAKASKSRAMDEHIAQTLDQAEGELRAPEKKDER